MRSQSRSTVGWILAPALIAAVWLPGGAAAAVKTGQSPDCRRYCLSVEPREGPEGSVFRFVGRHWRPDRRVIANFGVYCRPGDLCIDIAYIARMRTDGTGRFVFRLRAGQEQPRDDERHIRSGGKPSFHQRLGKNRTVTRRPRYTVVVPECGDCG